MTAEQAYRVMLTAHQRGTCVVAVFTREVAESKATEATELGRSAGYQLLFTTEPEARREARPVPVSRTPAGRSARLATPRRAGPRRQGR